MPGAKCGLSLLLFSPFSEVFPPGSSVFLPLEKQTSPNSNSISVDVGPARKQDRNDMVSSLNVITDLYHTNLAVFADSV